ncbi:MAG TPA: Imm26 family immunity protein [Tepidisphaeraceae bacterium]|nr:Imm26 family immunity protein [Tepidisphaeraceae bacterium]
MASKVRVQVGDVFQIPIDNVRVGYGQVVLRPEKNVLFICVFAATTPVGVSPDLDEIVKSDILLAGSTFDAKFRHGHWTIVGEVTSNLSAIALPVYKEGLGDKAFVETLDRSRRRPATRQEEQSLPFRTYTAPVGFEQALKAIAGVGEWLPAYDDLKYDALKASSEVIV